MGRGKKFCSNGHGQMSCPYMVKALKNLLLRNQRADDLETWYAALGDPSTTNFIQIMTLG